MHGHGTIVYANGDSYTGQFENGKEHGRGKLKRADGFECEGLWEMGHKKGSDSLTINQMIK